MIEAPSKPCQEKPKLQKLQAVDFEVGGLEIKVDLQYIKEVKSFWNLLTRHVKRRLLIMDGYAYSLESEDYGFFVVGVWNLDDLREVRL